jgi:Spy/CpxP family protein refolding chaperone
MKTTVIPTTLAVALMLATSPLAQAQPNPDRPDRPNAPAAEGPRMQRPGSSFQPGGPGGFRSGQGLPMLAQVLTEDQRDSMRQALESQRETMRDLQEKIRDARKALMTAALAEEYKDDTVQTRALAVAKLEAEVSVRRLKILAEVQPALSKAQLEKILNPPPLQGFREGLDGQRPPNRPANRPAAGGRDGDEMPHPPQPDNQ